MDEEQQDHVEEELTPEQEAALEAAFSEGYGEPNHENPGMEGEIGETLGDETEEELAAMRDMASASAGEEPEPPTDDEPEASDGASASAQDGSEPAGAEPTMADLQQQLANMGDRLRRSEGHLGNLQQNMRQMSEQARAATTAAGGDAPTQAQVNAAWKDNEKLKALQEEFPEFAETLSAVLDTALAGGAPAAGDAQPAINAEQITRAATEAAQRVVREELIADAYPDWEDVVSTEDFSAWLEQQPEAMQNLAASDRPWDAIQLLDAFQPYREFVSGLDDTVVDQHSAAGLLALFAEASVESDSTNQDGPDPEPQRRPNRLHRLRSAVPATNPRRGTTSPTQRSDAASDEAAFDQGFKNAR